MSVSAANGVRTAVVLVVEDDVLTRCGIAEHLREVGYTVVETASGEEAIGRCKSDPSIDIVFTDLHLIGSATGWDVADRQRLHGWNRWLEHVPSRFAENLPTDENSKRRTAFVFSTVF